ncbi:MAG: M23 family metallopeptidase [Terricaulis sp.]
MGQAEKIASFAVLLLALLAATLVLGQGALVRSAQLAHPAPVPMSAPVATSPTTPRLPARGLFSRSARDALIIPVDGLDVSALADTWGQARSEGRSHQGIDIMAPQGAPVLAAVDGRIVKFFDSQRGGVTIYQFDSAEHYVYYYAHLSRRLPGLTEGQEVRQGQVIAYVGSTGNATTPHLHFEIQRLGDEHKWWVAEAVNPYPFLATGRVPD